MRSWGVIMIGLEGSDDSSNDVRGIFPTTNYLWKG